MPMKMSPMTYGSCLLTLAMLVSPQPAIATGVKPYFPKSPWQSHSSMAAAKTSPIYREQWRQSKSRTCPILAIPTQSDVHLTTANSRSAYFADGWGVAYDLRRYKHGKPLRSAYGVANAGKTELDQIYAWPEQYAYADGSFVTLGREGNDPSGKFLAYLVLENGCFYNVWSQVSKAHLKNVLSRLRYVKP